MYMLSHCLGTHVGIDGSHTAVVLSDITEARTALPCQSKAAASSRESMYATSPQHDGVVNKQQTSK